MIRSNLIILKLLLSILIEVFTCIINRTYRTGVIPSDITDNLFFFLSILVFIIIIYFILVFIAIVIIFIVTFFILFFIFLLIIGIYISFIIRISTITRCTSSSYFSMTIIFIALLIFSIILFDFVSIISFTCVSVMNILREYLIVSK